MKAFKGKFFLAFYLIPILLFSQDKAATISGTIINSKGLKVPGINVVIIGTALGTSTDLNGVFELNTFTFGEYQLKISGIGYSPLKKTINIVSGQTTKLKIKLEESILEVGEVVIQAQSETRELEQSAKAVVVIETKELKLQSADLGEVMAKSQGISVRRTGGLGSNARFSLNGLTDDQIRFFLDGLPLDYRGFSYGISNVPVNLVSRIEVYKGVVPVEFGADALGGAVNLVSPKLLHGIRGSASYQLGSFGTHRASLDVNYFNDTTGLFYGIGGFYDYSKNNYKVDVEIPEKDGKLYKVNVPRFHDAYQAGGLRVVTGLRNKKRKDEISVELFANQYQKEIQNNNVMSIVYGEITTKEENYGGLLNYKNQISKNLKLDLAAGYSENNTYFVDTSKFIYNWLGELIKDRSGKPRLSAPGELGTATDQLITDQSVYGRVNLDYKINKNQSLHFTSSPNYVIRNTDERYIGLGQTDKPFEEEKSAFTWVNGLEYNWRSKSNKIRNSLFLKDYVQEVKAIEETNGAPINRNRNSHDMGYGNVLSYQPQERWLLKASYEWAARLPRSREIFGDGRLVVPNLSLLPERSHNANLEIGFFSKLSSPTNWKVSVSGFLRNTEQLILLLGNNEVFTYQNIFAAQSVGIEAMAFWQSANERLSLEANATYQDFRNQSSEGVFSRFDGDRIPNRPYFFSNGNVRYQFRSVFNNSDRLSFFFTARYIHEFFRGWKSVGLLQFKDIIPSQFVPNFGITYEIPFNPIRTALTAEIQNINDAKVFDFFGVQRPGRAFYLKLTAQF